MIESFLKKSLKEVFEESIRHDAKYLVGSSGSFDTFWDIHNLGISSSDRSPQISKQEFLKVYNNLITKNRKERLEIPGMISMRVDMIVGASIVTQTIMDRCNFDLIKVSSYALKEGVLAFGLPNRKQA